MRPPEGGGFLRPPEGGRRSTISKLLCYRNFTEGELLWQTRVNLVYRADLSEYLVGVLNGKLLFYHRPTRGGLWQRTNGNLVYEVDLPG